MSASIAKVTTELDDVVTKPELAKSRVSQENELGNKEIAQWKSNLVIVTQERDVDLARDEQLT